MQTPEQQTILVVEDDHLIRDSLSDLLTLEGFQVITANHGKQALEVLDNGTARPDIILLDLFMPVMDGLTFLEHFRKRHPRLSEIPVFLLSAAGKNSEALPRHYDPARIYHKPLDVDHLLQSIRKLQSRES